MMVFAFSQSSASFVGGRKAPTPVTRLKPRPTLVSIPHADWVAPKSEASRLNDLPVCP